MNDWQPHPIYGGAASILLPPRARDLSLTGTIPNNQEVWTTTNGLCVITELVEPLDFLQPPLNELSHVAEFHWGEIARLNHVTQPTRISRSSYIPNYPFQTYVIMGTQTFREISIYLALAVMRIPEVHTDVR